MGLDPRVIIIGGVACGPKTGCRLKRLMPEADITLLERDSIVSYGACGIPYFVEGLFPDVNMLNETAVGAARDVAFFNKVKGFKVITGTEVIDINRDAKSVTVKNHDKGTEEELKYDKLVLTTGASPIKPPLPGGHLRNVFYIRRPDDGAIIKDSIEKNGLKKAVLIGAGYIGLEMAEALKEKGLEVTIIEMLDHVLPQFIDTEMALLVEKHLKAKGVELLLGQRVLALEGDEGIRSIKTDRGEVDADLAVIAVGVRPNDMLAKSIGLSCSERGGIKVNNFCQTSDPDIYAGGDCVVNRYANGNGDMDYYVPLGSTANKHGRIIADHIAGLDSRFEGITSTGVCKIFDYTVGRTGITERQAEQLNLDVETVINVGSDLPHFFPGGDRLVMKMIADRKHRKILGFQILGPGEAAKRLDVAASAVFFGATLDQIGNIDLGYAPPFSPPIDPIITTAHVLLNKMNKIALGISPLEAKKRMDETDDIVLIDLRTPQEFEKLRLPDDRVVHMPLDTLREKYMELPKDKEILAFCKVSMRAYEAQRILNAAGFDRVSFIEGGLAAWPFDIWEAE